MYFNNFTVDIDEKRRLLWVTGLGEITYDYSIDVLIDLVKDPEIRYDFSIIFDLRSIAYQPTYEELISIKEKLIRLKGRFKQKMVFPDSISPVMTTIFLEFMFGDPSPPWCIHWFFPPGWECGRSWIDFLG